MDEVEELKKEIRDLKESFEEHQHSGNLTPRINPSDLAEEDEKYLLDTEIKTRKTWIDGRPIYRQVVDFGALPNTAQKKVAFSDTLPVAEFGTMVSIKPVFYNNTSTPPVLWGENASTDLTNYIQWRTYTNSTNTEAVCDTNFDGTGLSAYVTVEYTRVNQT